MYICDPYTLSKTLYYSIGKGLNLELKDLAPSPEAPKNADMLNFFLFKILQLGVSPENICNH